ncbi:MAG: hypothetical protein IV092_25730 [Burkholderiaceae bacterium]|nr:hypothetical protein [Burkholderiaceae bacterium]
MQQVDLISSRDGIETLEGFAVAFFGAMGVAGYEQRESENYTGGTYFIGKTSESEFNISISDDPQHEDMPYWVEVSALHASVVDDQVRERLLPQGFRVALVENFGETTERRATY